MGIDPNNPVVKLCAAGISAELAGRRDEAAKLYADAWNAKTFYLLAEGKVGALSDDAYADTVKRGIRQGLERIARAEEVRAHRN